MKINDVRINIAGSDSVEKVQSMSKEAAYAQESTVRETDKERQKEKTEIVQEAAKRDIVELHDQEEREENRRHRRRRRERNDEKKDLFCAIYTKNKSIEYNDGKGHTIDIKG